MQTFSDIGLADRPFANDLPVRLGNIDRRRPGTADRTAIKDQVHTTVHRAKNLDATTAGWLPGPVGAGGDDGHLEEIDQAGLTRLHWHSGPPNARCSL